MNSSSISSLLSSANLPALLLPARARAGQELVSKHALSKWPPRVKANKIAQSPLGRKPTVTPSTRRTLFSCARRLARSSKGGCSTTAREGRLVRPHQAAMILQRLARLSSRTWQTSSANRSRSTRAPPHPSYQLGVDLRGGPPTSFTAVTMQSAPSAIMSFSIKATLLVPCWRKGKQG